jgi:hypothetical protein
MQCGRPLVREWHGHHSVQHRDGGTTEVFNGEALCVACHRWEHDIMAVSGFKKD